MQDNNVDTSIIRVLFDIICSGLLHFELHLKWYTWTNSAGIREHLPVTREKMNISSQKNWYQKV